MVVYLCMLSYNVNKAERETLLIPLSKCNFLILIKAKTFLVTFYLRGHE